MWVYVRYRRKDCWYGGKAWNYERKWFPADVALLLAFAW